MFVRGGGDNTNNAYAEQENAGSCFFKMILILDILTIMIIYSVSVNRWCLSRPRYQQQAASLKHQSSISKPGRLQSLYIIVPGDQPRPAKTTIYSIILVYCLVLVLVILVVLVPPILSYKRSNPFLVIIAAFLNNFTARTVFLPPRLL